ncbi:MULTISPECIES: hypothetical protein [unclassified Streptomyces]|uniref:hypothetical protein n=1 Tax=unclassified Streptomyces TaxID=2593676 RepID=UPI002E10A98C
MNGTHTCSTTGLAADVRRHAAALPKSDGHGALAEVVLREAEARLSAPPKAAGLPVLPSALMRAWHVLVVLDVRMTWPFVTHASNE